MSSTSPDPHRWTALALLCTASFMVILDASIVTVAVPSIQRDLSFSAGGIQWVLSAYVVTFGGLLLFGGRAADLLGRRRLFMAGMGLFVAGSVLGGLAGSGPGLIARPTTQGLFPAFMTPDALSL